MNFWEKRKVLITGHTGFKGSWLSLWLQSLGAEVFGFALPPPTSPNLFDLADVKGNMTSFFGDIRDFKLVQEIVEKCQSEIIIHMAAQPLVRYSYKQPIETYAVNVMGTAHVLESARLSNHVKTVINVTSDKCYENKEWLWGYRETERLGGYDPYSNSKACSELLTQAYQNSYYNALPIGLASARAGNVIGGGDWAEARLIPDIIQAIRKKQTLSIRNPNSLRPWQHVLEPLSGYLLLAQKLHENSSQFSSSWNFGPQQESVRSVSWLVNYIVQQWNNETDWTIDENNHPHEAKYLMLDSTKSKTQLNWSPRWNIQQGLDKTIEWYKAFETNQNMREVTIAQIKNYNDLVT